MGTPVYCGGGVVLDAEVRLDVALPLGTVRAESAGEYDGVGVVPVVEVFLQVRLRPTDPRAVEALEDPDPVLPSLEELIVAN
jgi:hypothetical protein